MWGLTGFVPLPFTFVDGKKETFCAVQMRVQVRAAKLQEFSKLKNSPRDFTTNLRELMGINWNLIGLELDLQVSL